MVAAQHNNNNQLFQQQIPGKQHLDLLKRMKFDHEVHNTARITSSRLVFDTSNWRHLIDSTWGPGLSDSGKLSIFNQFWGTVDSNYAGFVGLPMYNWDSIINAMQAEILSGISKGRFSGLIGSLERTLNDFHTHFYDDTVNYGVYGYVGMPVYRGESGWLGACVTTLYDSLAMVYDVAPGQPFHLQPGDIILGYNGIPWLTLSRLMIQYQLPYGVTTGSTDVATMHRQIQAAGENWYLFDTINIQKCDGSIQNYPTSLMIPTGFSNLCTEQLPVPGVTQLTLDQYYYGNREVSSGVITGTRIGYVYMIDCSDVSGDSLYNSVKTLVEDSLVQGLIFDIRTNYGGYFPSFWKTYSYLHNGTTSWVSYGQRDNPPNKYVMDNPPVEYLFDVADTIPRYFNGPIAILDGPNAVSAGDFFSVLFKHQPQTKIFGKSSAGAFGAYEGLSLSDAGYYASMQLYNFYQVAAPMAYLTHTQFPVDYPMWFNRDSVCAGVDNIVSSAIQWINGVEAVKNLNLRSLDVYIFPNPADKYLNLSISASEDDHLSIKLCNALCAILPLSY